MASWTSDWVKSEVQDGRGRFYSVRERKFELSDGRCGVLAYDTALEKHGADISALAEQDLALLEAR